MLGAAYTLWMVKRVVFGAATKKEVIDLEDLDSREIFFLSLLAICILVIGVWPSPLLEVMHVSVENLLQHTAISKL